MEATCKYCGKPLTEQQMKRGGKYCSCHCAMMAQPRTKDLLEPKFCKNCGKPLTEKQIRVGNKYCSKSCSSQGRKNQAPPVPEVRCECCGKLLNRKQIANGGRYCSRDCAGKTTKERNHEAEERLYKKKCKACGKEFTSVGYRQKYCSEECREAGREASRARAREQYQERKEAAALERDKKHRLERDLAQANAHGMSYGQWKAMQYMQSLPKIEVRR